METKSAILLVCFFFGTGWELVDSYATWDKYLKNKVEWNYTIGINDKNHIVCTGDVAKQEGRIWSPYYVYDNRIKTHQLQQLYGDEICKKDRKYCRQPSDLSVLRAYDSFIDSGRRLLMIRNMAFDIFWFQFFDDGTRRPFQINEDSRFFWLAEPLPYKKATDYYRGFTYKSNMTGVDAQKFTEFIVKAVSNNTNQTFADLFKSSCPFPYTPYEPVAEVYAGVESEFDYYMVHLHCDRNQIDLWSLIVAADRYCQWNGQNESLWFVGLLNLQESVPDVTPAYNWWDPPNLDADLLFPKELLDDDDAGNPHAIFGGPNAAISVHGNNLLMTILGLLFYSWDPNLLNYAFDISLHLF